MRRTLNISCVLKKNGEFTLQPSFFSLQEQLQLSQCMSVCMEGLYQRNFLMFLTNAWYAQDRARPCLNKGLLTNRLTINQRIKALCVCVRITK